MSRKLPLLVLAAFVAASTIPSPALAQDSPPRIELQFNGLQSNSMQLKMPTADTQPAAQEQSASQQPQLLQGGVTRTSVVGGATTSNNPATNPNLSDSVGGIVYANVENKHIRPRTDMLTISVKDPEGERKKQAAIMGAIMFGLGAAAAAGMMSGGGGGGYYGGGGGGGGGGSCGGH